MSPGLIVSLIPVVARLVSIGTAQNGEASRGKNIHIAIASGAAYKPIWTGTPATDAYPIDSGINNAATLTAAIRSAPANLFH